MSEYQYYEFRAVDRPLTGREMGSVRRTSTRAEITPTSFVNEYNFGDYRGDPDEILARYYDLHVYYANWGTARWKMRVPLERVDAAAIEAYGVDGVVETWRRDGKLMIGFLREPEDGGDEMEDPTRWADVLEQLREDILAGDYRVLYLGWLSALKLEELVEDDTPEPPVPAGLGKLTKALKKFCDVFEVDAKLLKAAAEGSGAASEASAKELARWIAQLPGKEKDGMLLEIAKGELANPGAELMARYRKAHKVSAKVGGRTVRELRKAAGMG